MKYHISTGLIYEKFKSPCDCPLCEIQEIVEEQFIHEFLNDAVMDDDSREEVNKRGFCKKHFDLMMSRQNKLSLALQNYTRMDFLKKLLTQPSSAKKALKQAEALLSAQQTCIICDYTQESMIKYYKTIAQMFSHEDDFYEILFSTKGLCLKHYTELLRYASYAGKDANDYLYTLNKVITVNLKYLQADLKEFCDSHDYRNANKPLSAKASTSLIRTGSWLYGKEKK